ncbi:MAG TPA: DUF2637 domain-containing protein [Trebonia sp.]|jgi:hypothetical protein|nr:DUF2637 domain-containing protein [Trebonia sp.]
MTGWFRAYWPKAVSGTAILAVAVVAGWVSFAHIYELSLTLHQSVMVARLMPVGIDGLVVVGSVVLLQGGQLGWLGVGPGVGLSLFANVESGIRYGWLAAVWAGIPALSFFLATFILENWAKGQAKRTPAAAGIEPVSAPESAPVAAPADDVPVTPESAPEPTVQSIPGSAPKPALKVVRTAPRRLKARTPESTYAALLAAGELPSIRAIRRDMHVGDAKAKAIRAQLAEGLKQAA